MPWQSVLQLAGVTPHISGWLDRASVPCDSLEVNLADDIEPHGCASTVLGMQCMPQTLRLDVKAQHW
jgi:hypothetical protein